LDILASFINSASVGAANAVTESTIAIAEASKLSILFIHYSTPSGVNRSVSLLKYDTL
jgi:hypothetical protein